MRGLLGLAVALMVLMPAVALAQSPDRPVVEVGAQSSQRIRDEGHLWSLRLTVPVKRRTAIEATADIQRSYKSFGVNARISARQLNVHWRQTVFTSGSVQIFGVLGGGRNRVVHNVPERMAQDRVEPPYTFVSSEWVGHFGPAVQFELVPWLALRGDLRLTLGQRDSGVNVMVGAMIPIRRSRAGNPPGAPTPAPAPALPSAKPKAEGSTPPPAAWRRVKPGREVWVTTNAGLLVHGDVVAISDDSLIISEQDREVTIRLDEVRRVEGRDGVRNGFLIGTVPGAFAGGQLFSDYRCGSDCGSASEASVRRVFIAIGAVSGAIVGGLLGMMVDALIPGRQSLFERTSTRVIPILSPDKKAVRVTIDWR